MEKSLLPDERLIMLVEDNPGDEALTLRALKKNNINNRVVVARDGVEALNYLLGDDSIAERSPPLLPALVLLDLKLPKVDGIEVLRSLRQHSRTRLLPVIMLTSSLEDRDIASSYESGCNSYVRKPINFIDFTEAIRQLGSYWLTINVSAHRCCAAPS